MLFLRVGSVRPSVANAARIVAIHVEGDMRDGWHDVWVYPESARVDGARSKELRRRMIEIAHVAIACNAMGGDVHDLPLFSEPPDL